MRRVMPWLVVLVALAAAGASAASVGPHRFADGSPVAEHLDYLPPEPEGGHMPAPRPVPGLAGSFVADLVVSVDGEVSDVVLMQRLQPHADRALVRRLRQVRFAPARLDGKPVAAIYRVSYELYDR